jgi:hypothetical protein
MAEANAALLNVSDHRSHGDDCAGHDGRVQACRVALGEASRAICGQQSASLQPPATKDARAASAESARGLCAKISVAGYALDAHSPPPGYVAVMANPYGITLDDDALHWAAAEGVPEAVIAAVHLLPERSVDEVAAKLTGPQLVQVIKLVGLTPSAYPPGTLGALKSKAGTLPGTRAETARRRMAVEDLMKAGLSVRTIAAGTNIPRSSVHRAMCAIMRAEAKKQVAIAKIAEELLGKSLRPATEGRND